MADHSKIEWTEASWNPVTGCTKVSPGCDHCYAETFAERFRGTSGHYFEQGFDVVLREDKLTLPLRWKRPRRIFVNSMSDLFHDAVPDLYITEVFDVMESAKHHTFQLLTKRHARMRSFVRAREQSRIEYAAKFDDCPTEAMRNSPAAQWARERAANPPANIWLGVSVENQQWADIRVPALLDTPAAVRWLSCEPLLGPVDLAAHLDRVEYKGSEHRADVGGIDWYGPRIGWVVVGGESGREARPMAPAWAQSLRDQCQDAGVPFFFKQWGEWAPIKRPYDYVTDDDRVQIVGQDGRLRGRPWRGWKVQDGTRNAEPMRRYGKSAAGRELDGRTWNEYPTAAELAVA